MPYAEVNGLKLYYEAAGNGASVIFVHGGFANLSMALRDLAPYSWTWEWDFARCFQSIWYDRRGCYRSSSPEEGYEPRNQADDLEGLLNHLHIESAHVVGSSAGGPIALLFAAIRPNRVRSLVLVGTGLDLFPHGDRVSEIIREQLRILDREGPEAAFNQRPEGVETSLEPLWAYEEAEAKGALDDFLERERAFTRAAQQLPRQERIRYYAIELTNTRAYMDADLHSYAQQLTAPTLIMHGSEDRTVPIGWGRELAQAIPSAHLHIVEGGPHGLIFRNVEARRVAIQFMQRTDASLADGAA